MAKFYDVPVHWKDGSVTQGRGVGNNAAWKCKCKQILLGPHEALYRIEPCPGCEKTFRIVRGRKPKYVDHVQET
jgi:hypothetical protein